MAINEKPCSVSNGSKSGKYFLSDSFTLINAEPESGKILFAALWAFAYASPKLEPIPITSPVDFISGPRIGSTAGNLSKGKTASFTKK